MRPHHQRQGQRLPMLIRVGRLVERGVGFQDAPVAAVVRGDVGAVGAYGDPGFVGGIVSYGGAKAVGWGLSAGRSPHAKEEPRKSWDKRGTPRCIWL